MSSELEMARGRGEPYTASVAADTAVALAFAEAWLAIDDALEWSDDDEDRIEMRGHLASPDLVASYRAVISCVEALVGTELDYRTPGERGIGRMSTDSPRLGGAFRAQLSRPETRQVFGPIIEAAVRDAFAGAAAVSVGVREPVVVSAEEAFEKWIPQAVYGTQPLDDDSLSFIVCCCHRTEVHAMDQAQAQGLISGMRKKKREQAFIASASFWVAAGAALYWTVSQKV